MQNLGYLFIIDENIAKIYDIHFIIDKIIAKIYDFHLPWRWLGAVLGTGTPGPSWPAHA